MGNLKYQIEKPEKTDKLEAKSHENIANSVYKVIKEDNDVNVVGIEGELGSGKSTVVSFVKGKAENDDTTVIEFDVERYQHGATKKALIETIYDEVEKKLISIKRDISVIRKAKNIALGNHFEYTSKVDSNISIWIVWFAITLLIAVRHVKDALVGVGHFLGASFQELFGEASKSYEIDPWAVTALILLMIPFYIIICAEKKWKIFIFFGPKPPSSGDIFKRNSSDKITETIEINKEVGAYELEQALETFTDQLPESYELILVIDNLDRVSDVKLREVWSDIEVFTSIGSKNIRLLIPFSQSHISQALSCNMSEGREFISKRIPIIFRVAPILNSDWRGYLFSILKESIGDFEDKEFRLVTKIIDLWSPSFTTQVTPRLLKSLVNNVVSAKRTRGNDVSTVIIFYYQIAVQTVGISLDVLLKDIEHLESKGEQNNVKKTNKWINKLIPYNSWAKQLVTLHFQAPYELAESELLARPLTTALLSNAPETILEKSEVFGYDNVLTELIEENGTESIILIAAKIVNDGLTEYQEWLDKWLPIINSLIKTDLIEIDDVEQLSKAYETLQDVGHVMNHEALAREYERLNPKNDEELLDNDLPHDILFPLHQLGRVINKTPEIIRDFSPALFVRALWKGRNEFDSWKITSKFMTEDFAIGVLNEYEDIDDVPTDILEHIIAKSRVGWFSTTRPYENNTNSIVPVESVNLQPSKVILNLFYNCWYTNNYASWFVQNYNSVTNDQAKPMWLAQSFAQMLKHNDFGQISTLKSYLDQLENNSNFTQELSSVLSVSVSLSDILNAVEMKQTNDIISPAVKSLIQKNRVQRLSLAETLNKYEVLKSVGASPKEINTVISRWRKGSNFKSIEGLNVSFVHDVFTNKEMSIWRGEIIDMFSPQRADSEQWLEWLTEFPESLKTILEVFYVGNGKPFISCSKLVEAIKEYFSPANSETGEFEELNKTIHLVWKVLGSNSKGGIKRVLNKRILETSCPIELQQLIIKVFAPIRGVSLESPELNQQQILMLFENLNVDAELALWFDEQTYNFDKWEENNVEAYFLTLQNYHEQGYKFKNLIEEPTIKKLAEKRSEVEELE